MYIYVCEFVYMCACIILIIKLKKIKYKIGLHILRTFALSGWNINGESSWRESKFIVCVRMNVYVCVHVYTHECEHCRTSAEPE